MSDTSTTVHGLNESSSVHRNIFQVTKRSGEAVLFDEEKLKRSIVAALRSAEIEDNPISNQLVDEVMKKLSDELSYKDSLSTLDIREAVEIAFLERGLTSAAQHYHDYQSDDSQPRVDTLDIDEPTAAELAELERELASDEDVVDEDTDTQDDEPEELEMAEAGPVTISHIDDMEEPVLAQEDTIVSAAASEVTEPAMSTQAPATTVPDDRQAIMHAFELGHYKGYIIVSLFVNDEPAEVLLHMTQGTVDERGILDMFTTMLSASLRFGVPINELLPVGKEEQLHLPVTTEAAASEVELVQYIGAWLSQKFN